MTVAELIAALSEVTEHDPTVGAWEVKATVFAWDQYAATLSTVSERVSGVARRQNSSGPWVELVTS